MELNLSNIQHFSVGDGDGIRTTVFFKGCGLHCPWCHNPETIDFAPTILTYPELGKTEVRGSSMTVEAVMTEILEDADFYAESGGGVTLSGGEVLLQADGAFALAKAAKDAGLSVFLDTAGFAPRAAVEKLQPVVDCWLYDYKTADPAAFRQVIGGEMEPVRENLRFLLNAGANVRIRIPLIPGFNTGEESIEAIKRDLKGLGVRSVDLLPFHRLGSGKYTAMGLVYSYREVEPLTADRVEDIRARYEEFFTVTVE
ncbi:MAG: glycyl-radical enzyme activating protein [Clostridia bacterium]|nr:glycyl-radical enzyme activating protein [Clostridia bacterium]